MTRRERQRRRRRPRAHPARRGVLLGLLVVVCGAFFGALGVVGWVVSEADSAPSINQLHPQLSGHALSVVYAANGQRLGYISTDLLRTAIPQSAQPALLREATVAIEDRRFFHHGGVDYEGLIRAAFKDIFHHGSGIQGGSTLTMQLVKNIYYHENERTLKYKIQQAKLATELEDEHSKNWILTQYLNDVFYSSVGGQNAFGVAAASRMIFSKRLSQLDLAQDALLAGLPQAPSQYNPFVDPDAARVRRNLVLQAMVVSHYVTPTQASAAERSPLQVKANTTLHQVFDPYVFDYVRQELIDKLGVHTVDAGGLKVYTTIDPTKQAEAQQAVDDHEGGPGEPAAALVSIDPSDGGIVAMANTSKYGTGPGETTFSYASQGARQTGSAFKVFALMTLIHDQDGNPNETYYNSHLLAPGWLPAYPTYSVTTAEHSYQGVINVTKATWLSDNTVFAQLAQDLGMQNVSATAHAMGITSKLDNYPSEVLGAVAVSPLQMADAYATLASGGVHHAPTAISRVVLPDGRSISLAPTTGNRVFPYNQVYAADTVLQGVLTENGATGTGAYYGCPAAGKTGTTNNFTDAYFDGYTPQMTTAVWVGFPKETESVPDGYGGIVSAPIWRQYMESADPVGSCTGFTAPAVPWTGEPFIGHFSTAPKLPPVKGYGTSGASGTTGTGASGTSGTAGPGRTRTTGAGAGGAGAGPGGKGKGKGAGTGGNIPAGPNPPGFGSTGGGAGAGGPPK